MGDSGVMSIASIRAGMGRRSNLLRQAAGRIGTRSEVANVEGRGACLVGGAKSGAVGNVS